MKKTYLLLAAFASLAVFSTVSISTAYYRSTAEVIPSQICEARVAAKALGLRWDPTGLANVTPERRNARPIGVSCPLPRFSRDGAPEVYDLQVVYQSFGKREYEGSCSLYEVRFNGVVKQIRVAPFISSPGTQERIVWENVRIDPIGGSNTGNSLTVFCELPPKVQLFNFELTRVQPN